MRLEPMHSGLAGAAHSAIESDTAPSNHEVCPLCLARYAAALECICALCEAPSCPDCAQPIPGTNEMLCFACPSGMKH